MQCRINGTLPIRDENLVLVNCQVLQYLFTYTNTMCTEKVDIYCCNIHQDQSRS